jgi:purine-nucleoside phosphorylase
MGTPHINANKGDFAKVVLMPGDPLRAKLIAEKFLIDAKEVTNVRGILGYTGYTKNGKRISVMASGMGLPSIGIYSYELYTYYEVETIIRVGTCGAYQDYINLFDIILGATASTDSNWYKQYDLPQFSAGADFELASTCYAKAKEAGKKVHAGNILSADVFYDDNPEVWKKWARMNVLGVEMESYGLYCTANRLHKKALCLLTVTDHFIHKDQKATVEERQNNLLEMIALAVSTAEEYAD